jgi:hypothetical protein
MECRVIALAKLFWKKRLPVMDDLLVSAPRKPAGVAKAAGENHGESERSKKVSKNSLTPKAHSLLCTPRKKAGLLKSRVFFTSGTSN